MRGTGSHDVVLDGVFVPDDWTFDRNAGSSLDTPLFRYPPGSFVETARERGATYGRPALADRATAQSDLATAAAELRSARAYLFAVTDDALNV
jgi:alkylation response protein AidB-like acyl-CoA dehydrogenase